MRRRTKSPFGNASGSPSARIAMYSAVQSPMPGSSLSADTIARASALELKTIVPSATRRANMRIVSARERTTPARSIAASASWAGVGNSRSIPLPLLAVAPHIVARRPASVVAPRTEIC